MCYIAFINKSFSRFFSKSFFLAVDIQLYDEFQAIQIITSYRKSVAGSVIQITGTLEFEDGLRTGVHL